MQQTRQSLPKSVAILLIPILCLTLIGVTFLNSSEIVEKASTYFSIERAIFAPWAISLVICVCHVASMKLAFTWFAKFRKAPLAGLAILISTVSTLISASVAIAMFNIREDLKSGIASIEDMGQATLSFENGILSIVGPIGDGLSTLVQGYARPESPINEIQITSEGGFVTDALELAKFIERKSIKVVVLDYCYSACVLVAVSSPKSYAMPYSEFGFHNSYPAFDAKSQLVKKGQAEWRIDSDAYLKAHGVPESVLVESRKKGPAELFYVSAQDALEAKFIDGVIEAE